MLTGRGFLASQTRAPPGQRAYAVVICTEQGAEFVRSQQPLVLPLSGDMLQQEAAVRQAAEAAAAARLEADALEAQKNVVQAEEQRLFKILQDVRKVSEPACGWIVTGLNACIAGHHDLLPIAAHALVLCRQQLLLRAWPPRSCAATLRCGRSRGAGLGSAPRWPPARAAPRSLCTSTARWVGGWSLTSATAIASL